MALRRDDSDSERLLDDGGFTHAAAGSVQASAAPSRLRLLARLHA